MTTLTSVNTHVSDLFFNLDHSEATVEGSSGFDGYDDKAMHEQAKWFADAIAEIGGPRYTPEEIIEDFYARI